MAQNYSFRRFSIYLLYFIINHAANVKSSFYFKHQYKLHETDDIFILMFVLMISHHRCNLELSKMSAFKSYLTVSHECAQTVV